MEHEMRTDRLYGVRRDQCDMPVVTETMPESFADLWRKRVVQRHRRTMADQTA